MSAPEGFRTAFARLPWLAKLVTLALMGAILAMSVLLWPAWMHNPDLSHGRFMPLVFLLLLFESRRNGPARFLRSSWRMTLGVSSLVCLAIATLVAAGLWAAMLEWNHDLVVFSTTISGSLLLGAALIAFADERVRLLPFNWAACTAIMLWPVSAPIPPGTYTRISIALQLWISSSVVKVLNFLGVAAFQMGNVIELTRTTLGVDEACSGVRSLVSCLFAGFFLSATLVRKAKARITLIVLAPLLALGMNFIRSLALALLANAGIDIAKFWHDTAGLIVIGLTTLLLAALALWLERGNSGQASAPDFVAAAPSSRLRLNQGLVATACVLCASLAAFFYTNSHPAQTLNAKPPNLAALLPAAPEGWRAETATDLLRYRDILLTEDLVMRVYQRDSQRDGTVISIYMAYWKPGQVSVSQVALHTPDACWPGTGWLLEPVPERLDKIQIEGRSLAAAESRCFSNSGFRQNVWFWHLHNGRPIPYRDPYSFTELLKIAWLYGFQHGGDQLFIRISSNRPWSEISQEPVLRQFFKNTQSLGL